MKTLKRILIGLAALIILLVLISLVLPSNFHLSREKVIQAPQPVVFDQVNTLRNWEKWSPWHRKDPNIKLEYEGPASGTGAKYLWDGNSKVGKGSVTISKSEPYTDVAINMHFDGQGDAEGNYKFEKVDEGTKVIWSMDSDAGWNPIGRYMNLIMDGFIGPDFEAGLNNLDSVSRSVPASGTTMAD